MAKLVCGNCGTDIQEGWTVCPTCHTPILPSSAPSAPVAQPAPMSYGALGGVADLAQIQKLPIRYMPDEKILRHYYMYKKGFKKKRIGYLIMTNKRAIVYEGVGTLSSKEYHIEDIDLDSVKSVKSCYRDTLRYLWILIGLATLCVFGLGVIILWKKAKRRTLEISLYASKSIYIQVLGNRKEGEQAIVEVPIIARTKTI